jgi:hypothetical protein
MSEYRKEFADCSRHDDRGIYRIHAQKVTACVV